MALQLFLPEGLGFQNAGSMAPKTFRGEQDHQGPQIVERAKLVPLHLLSIAENSGHREKNPLRIQTLRSEFENGNFMPLGSIQFFLCNVARLFLEFWCVLFTGSF